MSEAYRLGILKQLANGALSANEAADRLRAGAGEAPAVGDLPTAAAVADGAGQQAAGPDTAAWLRVRVSDLATGESKVSVNIPLRMVALGLTVANHFSPEKERLDLDAVQTMLHQGERGILVDVRDEDNHQQVEIFLD